MRDCRCFLRVNSLIYWNSPLLADDPGVSFALKGRGSCNVLAAFDKGSACFHADRTTSGDRDHCDPDRTVVARRPARARGVLATEMPEPDEANRDRPAQPEYRSRELRNRVRMVADDV